VPPERLQEEGCQVEPFQPIARHAGRQLRGVRAPQFFGIVEQKELRESWAVALEGHLAEVVGIVRDARNGELLPRNLGQEGHRQRPQQVVGRQRKVDAAAPPANLAGGVDAAEVVTEERLHVGRHRRILIVKAVRAGVVAEGAHAERTGIAAHRVRGLKEAHVEPLLSGVKAGCQARRPPAENR